jgi:hypothetical protein
MPFRGLLNGILGNQSNGQGQAEQGTIVHSAQTDAMQYQNQQGQQQQISNEMRQALHQGINWQGNQQAQQINQSIFGSIGTYEAWRGRPYQHAIEYDLSDATTLKCCDIVKKAIERLWLK